MSSIITGDLNDANNSQVRTVTDATNASPIEITTSANHEFQTGDIVLVDSVLGNTAANGVWQVTVLTATTFELDGSTGNGAWSAGGSQRATRVTLGPAITIPSDGDDIDAASVNVAFEALAARTQLVGLLGRMSSKTWTADGTWLAPDNIQPIGFLVGCGGGGGGGGGASGTTEASKGTTGGGGGGGATLLIQPVILTAASTYTIDIGAGGAGGSAGNPGSDGADSTFGSGTTYTFPGASGGRGGVASVDHGASAVGFAAGGAPQRGVVMETSGVAVPSASVSLFRQLLDASMMPARGGAATSKATTSKNGQPSTTGFAGGTAGTAGADDGTAHGGGGGGGGGAGPYAVGANGADGGAGSSSAPVAGSAGSAAIANSGSGGGGGGGGGSGPSSPAAGGAGGAGGSGKLTLFWFGPPTP